MKEDRSLASTTWWKSLGLGWMLRFLRALFALGRAEERRRQEQMERVNRMVKAKSEEEWPPRD